MSKLFQTPMGITTCCNQLDYSLSIPIYLSFKPLWGLPPVATSKLLHKAIDALCGFKPLWGLPPVATSDNKIEFLDSGRFKPLWGLPPVATG